MKGGRQKTSERETIQEVTAGLQEWIKKMVLTHHLISECLRQLKPSKEEAEEEPEGLLWKDEPLHSMHHRQTEKVAVVMKCCYCSAAGEAVEQWHEEHQREATLQIISLYLRDGWSGTAHY